jgi:metal-responsive CopG/Arc/MetJ family transcriptional regulator
MSYQTFNISLPKDLVSAMDSAAKKEYRNRSDLIREAVRVYLADHKAWDELFVYGAKQAKKLGIASEKSVNARVAAYRKGK